MTAKLSTTPQEQERTEGWGDVHGSSKSHFFREDRSLCGGWLALGGPMWSTKQALGTEPGRNDCKACWRKRAQEEANG